MMIMTHAVNIRRGVVQKREEAMNQPPPGGGPPGKWPALKHVVRDAQTTAAVRTDGEKRLQNIMSKRPHATSMRVRAIRRCWVEGMQVVQEQHDYVTLQGVRTTLAALCCWRGLRSLSLLLLSLYIC